MDVKPIEMSYGQARETIRAYHGVLKDRRRDEDLAILRSAKAVMRGLRVISMSNTILAGGFDSTQRPRLAIVRADKPWCHLYRWNVQTWFIGADARHETWVTGSHERFKRLRRAKPLAFSITGEDGSGLRNEMTAVAMAPSIPPAHRPSNDALDRYYLLWEAEWQRTAPVDPALLAPLGGGMFAIVAMWDLTPLERAVLGEARR